MSFLKNRKITGREMKKAQRLLMNGEIGWRQKAKCLLSSKCFLSFKFLALTLSSWATSSQAGLGLTFDWFSLKEFKGADLCEALGWRQSRKWRGAVTVKKKHLKVSHLLSHYIAILGFDSIAPSCRSIHMVYLVRLWVHKYPLTWTVDSDLFHCGNYMTFSHYSWCHLCEEMTFNVLCLTGQGGGDKGGGHGWPGQQNITL